MKKLLLTTAATLLTVAAFGQGLVNFSNASSIAGWDPIRDRHVYFGWYYLLPAMIPGAPVSSNHNGLNLGSLRAALYYAPSTQTDPLRFQAAAGGPATFRVSTSTTVGSWFGGTRTLTGIAPGVTANMIVVVWDSAMSSDPFSAAAWNVVTWGRSPIFQYTPPTSATPAPAELLMQNLASFNIGIPEPSTFALAGLGAAALLIGRRQRQN